MAPSPGAHRLSAMHSRPAGSGARSSSRSPRGVGRPRCPFHENRTQVVFGAGNADADLMFIGEAPGQQEDLQGLPFVGRAGKLLDELIVRDRPRTRGTCSSRTYSNADLPGNRDPQPDEIETCRPYLHRQVELIEPRLICTLGNFATKLLTRSNRGHHLGSRPASGARARRPDGEGPASVPSRRQALRSAGTLGSCATTSPASRRSWPSRLRCRSGRWRRSASRTRPAARAGTDEPVQVEGGRGGRRSPCDAARDHHSAGDRGAGSRTRRGTPARRCRARQRWFRQREDHLRSQEPRGRSAWTAP